MTKTLFVILLFFSIPGAAFTSEITLAMRNGNFMPYQYFPDNQTPQGLYIDIVKEAGKQLDIEITIKKYSWKLCQKHVISVEVDGVIGAFKAPELLHALYFTEEPLAFEELAFFTLKTRKIEYNGDINTLCPFTIGLIDGYSLHQARKKHNIAFTKLDYHENSNYMIQKLLGNKIPFMVYNKMIFEYFSKINKGTIAMPGSKKAPLDQIVALHPSIGLNAGFLAFSKANNSDFNKQLAGDFSIAIKEIKKSDLFFEILDKHADF